MGVEVKKEGSFQMAEVWEGGALVPSRGLVEKEELLNNDVLINVLK